MPRKTPDTKRFGGPGSSQQDRQHPEKSTKQDDSRRQERPRAADPRKYRAAGASGTNITRTTRVTRVDLRRTSAN